jgi:hypothetical protein
VGLVCEAGVGPVTVLGSSFYMGSSYKIFARAGPNSTALVTHRRRKKLYDPADPIHRPGRCIRSAAHPHVPFGPAQYLASILLLPDLRRWATESSILPPSSFLRISRFFARVLIPSSLEYWFLGALLHSSPSMAVEGLYSSRLLPIAHC